MIKGSHAHILLTHVLTPSIEVLMQQQLKPDHTNKDVTVNRQCSLQCSIANLETTCSQPTSIQSAIPSNWNTFMMHNYKADSCYMHEGLEKMQCVCDTCFALHSSMPQKSAGHEGGRFSCQDSRRYVITCTISQSSHMSMGASKRAPISFSWIKNDKQ